MWGWRVLLFASSVFGLFEDQIGTFDWRRELIGYPVLTAFEQVKGPSEFITVYTNLGILASLSARDGSIVWRRTMPQFEKVKYLFGLRGVSVSVSEFGIVRYWDSSSGVLLREVFSKLHQNSPVTTCSRLPSKSAVICAREKGEETALSVFSERAKLFEFNIATRVQTIITDEGKNVAFLVGLADEVLTVQSVHLNDYSPDESAHSINVPGLTDLKDISLSVDNKIVYVRGGASVVSVDLVSGELETVVEDLGAGDCSLVGTGQTEVRHATDAVLFTCGKQSVLIVNLDAPQNRVVLQSNRVKVHPNILHPFATVQLTDGETGELSNKFQIVNFVDGQVLDIKAKHDIRDMWLNIYPTKTKHEFKVLSLGADGTLRFTLRESELWSREEALSEISRVEIIDLPPDSNHHVNPQDWSMSQRISIQWTLLKTWLNGVLSEIESGNMFQPRSGDPLVSDQSLYRDQFNLHKLIFIVTRNGNVYGLDSFNSEIIWKRRVPELDSCSHSTLVLSDTNMNEGNILIIGKCSDAMGSMRTEMIGVNPMTGQIREKNVLDGEEVLRAESLRSHVEHVHPAVVLTKGEKDEVNAKVLGNLEGIEAEVREELEATTFWLVNDELGQVKGGRVHLAEEDLGGELKNDWTFQTPSNHKISAIGSAHPSNVIHSQGRPLADRSVLYKYLNPNMMAIVTESTEKTNVEAMAVTLYVLDGVTGQILHSANHKRSQGPVNIVMAENWIVYSYWAAKMHRTELTAVEFYLDNQGSGNETHWNSLRGDTPVNFEKSFVLSERITGLGVTHSPRGITNKAVLVATASGNIVAMPRMFFDPRRRLHPIPTDREEGIMPYDPELKLPPNFNVNYNQTIANVREFHVAVSRLESICIVLAVGHCDLFWTRVQPSGMFDVLKDDFDHRIITVIMIGFFLGTAACKRLAQLKVTNRLWQ